MKTGHATSRSKRPLLAGLLGLVIGCISTFLVPDDWLFEPGEGSNVQARDPDARWACPMFCVVLDELPERPRCPVCGMVLERVRDDLRLDEHERFMAGVETAVLRERPLHLSLRQIGEVDYDETRLTTVTTRVTGFLEKVHVRETWVPVQTGQELVEIYSPELYEAQTNYLLAWERAGKPATIDAVEDPTRRAVLESTHQNLRNFGIDDREIEAIRAEGGPRRRLTLRASADGVVIRRNVVEGAATKAGEALYVIADLSRVWIQLEVFEHDHARIDVGRSVEVLAEALPDQAIVGEVSFVDPVIDRRTRTARVRVSVENPHLVTGRRLFQPGQRVDARIRVGLGANAAPTAPKGEEVPLLALPVAAILETGLRQVAFVLYEEVLTTDAEGQRVSRRRYDLDPATLPRTVGYELVELVTGPVALDPEGERCHPVLELAHVPRQGPGLRELAPGLVFVAQGAFLLDSQAQLAGKPSLLHPEGAARTDAAGHAGHAGH